MQVGLWYHLWRAYGAQNQVPYYILKFLAVSCFPIGIYYKEKHKAAWASALWHSGVHILANIGNWLLYTAYMRPL